MSRPELGRAPSSVGDLIETNQIYNLNHPAYQLFKDAVAQQLNVLAEREAVRQSSARTLVLPFHLDSEQRADLADDYPEFAVTSLPLSVPVHSYWNASRTAANEWLVVNVAKYGQNVVHFGGHVLSNMVASRPLVHVEASLRDEVAVHENYADRVAAMRIFEDSATLAKDNKLVLSRQDYDAFCDAQAYQVCVNPGGCTHQADSLCVDVTSAQLSPEQVAAAMSQHGAEVCMGFFIYDPAMLVQQQGELGSTGVFFDKTEDRFEFRYTEGRSGVSHYSRAVWSRWCSSHCFSIDAERKKWFQLELLKQRGPFMFFRMVQVSVQQGSMTITHSLELNQQDEYVLVKSWRLRNGLASDPSRADSWDPHHFLMRDRVVRRAYEFAMQLTPINFTRHSLKKQIRVVNNRWVVQGSVVSVAPALDPRQIEDFLTAVYARAFVDRYDSSQLSTEMMHALGKMVAFNEFSTAKRVWVVAGAISQWMYTRTLGKVEEFIRGTAAIVSDFLRGGLKTARDISWAAAPEYVKLTTANNRWYAVFCKSAERYYGISDAELGIDIDPHGPGGAVAACLRMFAPRTHRRSASGSDGKAAQDLISVMRVVTDVHDTSLGSDVPQAEQFVAEVSRLNEIDSTSGSRHMLEYQLAERRGVEDVQSFRNAKGGDQVAALNQLYLEAIPNMALTEVEYDTFSLSLDPQDRTLAAPYLRMPTYFGLPPAPREYYKSKLKALSVPKRQNTAQELLTAVAARNLSAPAISAPQNDEVVIRDVWKNFLAVACVPDAEEKLLQFQSDPVALESGALKDWVAKAKPDVVERLVREMKEQSVSLGEKSISEYLIMIKADVKPTMSDKPVKEVTAPQVIVYHDKLLSALYSSMIRVLVRRFLSLLRPEYHINLLKDTRDIESFLTSVHPHGTQGLQYLENDFSKYDKSQSEFAFLLEEYVFQQLGLSQAMLDAWQVGHAECSLRSVSLGMSLHVMYQRKSGDATTAFGNVILNVLSVLYAYQGTRVVWAVFMGDDSIVCATKVNSSERAVAVLAEVFNLTAKFYITDAPYFASNFLLLDGGRLQVRMVPDVIKRIERLSMSVSADDPQWRERWISFQDAMVAYRDPSVCAAIGLRVPLRYSVSEGLVSDAAHALGALTMDYQSFRGLWDDDSSLLQA